MRGFTTACKDWIKSWWLWYQTRSEIPALRQYALEHFAGAEPVRGTPDAGGKLVLGVVGGYPFLGYVRLGYDWVAAYYNPLRLFAEVHYFQILRTRTLRFDLGYPFFVHYFGSAEDIVRIGRKHGLSLVRAYDPVNGVCATEAARELNVPVVVSVH
ncbi:MAG TPA: hypothetical protein EYP56_05245 [Planctomycetaceae bacterium]|nr:hypothetical protein [Planctomycetaceae bacterium]